MTTDEENLVLDNIGLVGDLASKYYMKFNCSFEYEDLRSVGMVALAKAAKSYNKDLGFAFSTYAYKIIKNEIILYFNLNKNHNTNISLSKEVLDGLELGDTIPLDYDFFDDLEKTVENEKLYEAIESLEENHKKIINYRLQGLTYKQIGKIMGTSHQNVNSMYNRALNILRYKLRYLRR